MPLQTCKVRIRVANGLPGHKRGIAKVRLDRPIGHAAVVSGGQPLDSCQILLAVELPNGILAGAVDPVGTEVQQLPFVIDHGCHTT
jgi:hypothetical protein